MIFPVILCGGSGERLWPLSRKSRPKQFLELVGNGSLFQQSATRILCRTGKPVIVTNDHYRFIVRQQLQEAAVVEATVIIEPEEKNTGPAILAAAEHVARQDPSGIMVVMPSDHYIPEQDIFTKMVIETSDNILDGQIICLGVQPRKPETGYGYIKVGNTKKTIFDVEEFVEKPNKEMAKEYLNCGDYLWNAGIFIVKARELLKLANRLQPEMMRATRDAYDNSTEDLDFIRLAGEPWSKIKSDSFDYAFMEKANNIGCKIFEGAWSDIGDWNELATKRNLDSSGNNLIGNSYQIDSKNSVLWADSAHQVLTGIGLENIFAVATPDAVLVADKSKSQEVRSILKTLKSKNHYQATDHKLEHRPWGSVKTVARGKNYHVKILNVLPGSKLSLQSHNQRTEHWIVIKGIATIFNEGRSYKLLVNESTFIKTGAKHMLENNEFETLTIVEIQTVNGVDKNDFSRGSS